MSQAHKLMTPGTYLRKRRVAANFTLNQVAAGLAALHQQMSRCCTDAAPPQRASFLQRLSAKRRLREAEEDRLLFTKPQVEILALFVPLDPHVYEQLVDLRLGGPNSGLPEPHLCRSCGCSFLDPCRDDFGILCTWARLDSNICTGCLELLSSVGPNEARDRELVA